jgi:regulator of sirC expression with transglutaminase-like and TPR domain
MKDAALQRFADAARGPDPDLARPALAIALIEYPRLDPEPYLARLDMMGAEMERRLAREPRREPVDEVQHQVAAMNAFLFGEMGFAGNRTRYDDPRNSFLNQVLDRRTGIPISLALVYIEVSRRAGLGIDGVNFPGHFLLRAVRSGASVDDEAALIVDPFHGGVLLDERDCRRLLQRHLGDEAAFSRALLAPASKQQILTRMVLNLKRLYIAMRSFGYARLATDFLLAVDPSALSELRDRGLLHYHLHDFSPALRDLQDYLRLSTGVETDREEREQLWEHVKNLRRRVAEMN